MQQKKKSKKVITPVKKPFMRGKPVDGNTFKGAVFFFFGLLGMVVANVLVGSMAMWDVAWLNILFNCALLLVLYYVFFQNGAGKGTAAVNQGEIMLQRQEAGRGVSAKEAAVCFHPLKGFVTALLGSLPVLVCAVLLAFVAQLQYTGLGMLPTWISSLQRQPEMAGALAFYDGAAQLTMEDILRVIVRMMMMPYVNMVGSANREGLLMLERLSALVVLLPALCYGVGYLQGVSVRTRVHTEIAMGKRKRVSKDKKRRQARSRVNKGPEQLN